MRLATTAQTKLGNLQVTGSTMFSMQSNTELEPKFDRLGGLKFIQLIFFLIQTQVLSHSKFIATSWSWLQCTENSNHNKICLGQLPSQVIQNHQDITSRLKSTEKLFTTTKYFIAHQSGTAQRHVAFVITPTQVLAGKLNYARFCIRNLYSIQATVTQLLQTLTKLLK